MTVVAELITEVKGREVGLSDLLTRITAQSRQADAAGQQTAQVFGAVLPSSMQRSTNSALSLQQAQARLEAQQGNVAGAAQRLTNALAQQDAATVQTINVERQLLNLQNQLAGSTSGLSSHLGGLTNALGAVGIGLGAAQLARAAVDLTQVGAQAQQTRTRFDQLATTAHTTGDAMLASLRQASAGTINDTNLELAAMKANLLGVADSAAELGPLLAIARDRAQQMGISTAFAFDSLVTGLGRGSRLILDNIGIMVKEGEVNEVYAKSVGKTVAALTDQEKKQALVNEVLRQGQATLAQTGGAIDSNVVKIERLNASMDNLKAKAGGAFANLVGGAADGAVKVTSLGERMTQLNGAVVAGATSYTEYTKRVQFANQELAKLNVLLGLLPGTSAGAVAPLTEDQFRYAQSLIDTGVAADVAAVRARDMGVDIVNSAIQAGTALLTQAFATDHLGSSMQAEISGAIAAEQAHQAQAAALGAQNAQTVLASTESQILGAEQQLLQQAALNAATGLNASGNAAAVLAGQFNITTAQADQLIARMRVLAQLQNTLAVGRATQVIGSVGVNEFRQEEQVKVEKNLAGFYERLGQGAGRFNDATTKTHRAGGAARMSDQTKLNNTLLNDQARYEDQSEAQALEHTKNVLKIQADYDKKSLEQQKANEISKRSSELDFLKSITSSELNETKTGRAEIARINERFYADFAEAQKAAQVGNAKLSEELVNQARDRAKTEQSYAEQIDAAREEKNAGEVARLTTLREKERQILDEQRKQLLEGGDTNAAAKQDALTAEDTRFIEQQDKSATAAENAAQRKIDASDRSGKKIDAENTKLREQEAILNRIGPRQPGGAAATPAPGGAPVTVGPVTSGAPTDLSALADALRSVADQITAAIDGAKTAITSAQRDTTGAVRGLEGRALG